MTPGFDPHPAAPSETQQIADLQARLAQAQADLLREQRRFQAVFREQFQFSALLSPEGRVLDFNQQFLDRSGPLPRDQVLGRLYWDTAWWQDLPELRAAWPERLRQAATDGYALFAEDRFIASDGELRHAAAAIVAVRDTHGELDCFVIQACDITERRRAEQQRESIEARLREAQKLEAIGTLAGGIAHDFNNIVGAILGNVALARQAQPEESAALAPLDQIDVAAHRARHLVRQLLTFSRRQSPTMEVLALQVPVHEALALLRWMLPPGVELQARVADSPQWVHADPAQMQQVLINLCSNAWQALGGTGGHIEVTLAPDEASDQVRLSVHDDGCGIDAATRARIFEPFFTTRAAEGGTGLGLSVAHGIVVDHGGCLEVDTAPGQGSTFTMWLPRVAAPEQPAAETSARAPVDGRGRHVAYVDDDDTMAVLADTLLRRAGFRVSLFRSAAAALQGIAEAADPPEIVITDYNMPGQSGIDLARQLAGPHPQLPVIILSGYVTDTMTAEARAAGVRHVLHKEDTLDELCPLVQHTLPAAAAPG